MLFAAKDSLSDTELRMCASRVATKATQHLRGEEADSTPQPFAGDPGDLAQLFSGCEYTEPRVESEWPLGIPPDDTSGKLARWSAQGHSFAHRLYCQACHNAFKRGEVCRDCPMNISVTLAAAEGGLMPWADGPPKQQVLDLIHEPRYSLTSADPEERRQAQVMIEKFDKALRKGFAQPVPKELYDLDSGRFDPDHIMIVTQVCNVKKTKLRVPAALAEAIEAADGKYSVAEVSASAQAAAATDADRYLAEYEALKAAGRRIDHAALLGGIMAPRLAEAKDRPIFRCDVTINPLLKPCSLSLPGIASFAGKMRRGDWLISDDMSDGYYHQRWREEYWKYGVVQHPVTLELWFQIGMHMGNSSACAQFAMPTANMRLAYASSPAARAGEADVDGFFDDSAHAIRESAVESQRKWNKMIDRIVCAQKNDKTQEGKRIDYLGARLDSEALTATIRPAKLWDVLYRLWFLRRLLDSGAPAFVDFDFYESTCGNVTWLSEFNLPLKPRRGYFYASLSVARQCGFRQVRIAADAPCAQGITFVTERAAAGTLTGMRYFPASEVAAVRLACMPIAGPVSESEAALRAQAASDAPVADGALLQTIATADAGAPGRPTVGTASDASFMPETGHRAWAIMAEGEVIYGQPTGAEAGWHADALEMRPVLELFRERKPLLTE